MYITLVEFIICVSQELLIIFIMDSSLLLLLGKKARWFQLHTIGNIYITYKSLPDVHRLRHHLINNIQISTV